MSIIKKISYEQKKEFYGLLFIMPWIIGFLVFFLRPILVSLYYSFSNVTLSVGGVKTDFIGLVNFENILFKNTEFLPALFNTVGSLLFESPLVLSFSLFISLILNTKFYGRAVARSVFFIPVIIASGVVITLLKNDVFASTVMSGNTNTLLLNASGLNTILSNMNVPPSIISMLTGVVNNIFDLVWKSGIQILLFLSALQSIPSSFYEASSIEGANKWVSFWKITFPMLGPMLVVGIIYTIIDSFTYYSNPIMKIIDTTYKKSMQYSLASAMSWGYFLIIMVVIGIVFLSSNKLVSNNEY